MKFPIAKQITSKTIADEIIPVTPTLEGPPIKETYTHPIVTGKQIGRAHV